MLRIKNIIGLIIIAVLGAGCYPSESDKVLINTPDVIKSPNDHREYAYEVLSNGLKVMLVSDFKAEKAAATLDVHIGSFNDPDERLGLAHFTEHMLFIGTEKYPSAGEYHTFIKSMGGSSNAYTAGEDTVYFFDIKPEAFDEAIERFSQFFISPTFDPDYVERERNAVDSEYRLRFKDDAFRRHAVEMLTANPNHPGHRFHVGNLETLSDTEESTVHQDLIDFYKAAYSADKMTLAMVSPESLSSLREKAHKYFDAVPKNEKALINEWPLMITEAELGQDLYIVPQEKIQQMSLLFPNTIPRDYETHPSYYIQYLLSDSSPGGLLNHLKSKHWITDLGVEYGRISGDQNIIAIHFSLSDDGINHIDDITEATFSYLRFLEKDGIAPWVFEEIKANDVRDFIFQEYVQPRSMAMHIATALQEHPSHLVIANQYLLEEAVFDESKIKTILAELHPRNMRRVIVYPEAQHDQIESYFSVPFSIQQIPEAKKAAWMDAGAIPFQLDEPNQFLPTDFSIIADEDYVKYPNKIEVEHGKLWHLQNIAFQIPKINTQIGLWTKDAQLTPEHSLKTTFYLELLSDQLQEKMRQIVRAGSTGAVMANGRGLMVAVSGYSHYHPEIVKTLLNALTLDAVAPEHFENIKDELRRSLESYYEAPPYALARDVLEANLVEHTWLPEEMLPYIEALTQEDVRNHAQSLLKSAYPEVFIHGNVTAEQAEQQYDSYMEILSLAPSVESYTPRLRLLQPGERLEAQVQTSREDALAYIGYQASSQDLKEYAQIAMLSRLLGAEFFSILRTEEQLGYLVQMYLDSSLGLPRLNFVVQSPNSSELALYERIQRFIGARNIDAIEDSVFEAHRDSYLQVLRAPEKTLGETFGLYWSEIALGAYRFDLKMRLAEVVQTLTKEELATFYREKVQEPSNRREIFIQTAR